MILYGTTLSPFVRKVLAFAHEKGLELELVQIGLGSPDPGFLEASPFRKMPAFRDGDFMLADSTAIITYLEALHPNPNLIPAEAKARAKTIWFEEFSDTIVTASAAKIFGNKIVKPIFRKIPGDEAASAEGQAEMPAILDYLEGVIPSSGFLVEDRLTLADLAVASPFANLDHCAFTVDGKSHPKTAAYVKAILDRPSYAPVVARERAMIARASA